MTLKVIFFTSYLFFTAVLANFGCNSSETKKEVKKHPHVKEYNNYFPVQAGNKWEYINDTPREDTVLIQIEINDIKFDGEDIVAEISSFPFFSTSKEPAVLRVNHDGNVYALNSKTNKEELFIPSTTDLKNGFTWQFSEWKGIVGSTDISVITDNKTYDNCIFLNFSIYYTFSAEIWVAKDIGIVKWGYNRTNPPTLKPQYYVLNKLSLVK